MRTFVAFLFLVFAFGYVLINYSAKTSTNTCVSTADGVKPLHVRLEEYGFWVGLWADSDGAIWIDQANGMQSYFRFLEISETAIRIYYDDGEDPQVGEWSKISNKITLEREYKNFSGECRPTAS